MGKGPEVARVAVMSQLVDTTVFASMERRGIPIEGIVNLAPDEPSALAAISASELLITIHRAPTLDLRRQRELFVRKVLDAFPVLPFDERAAEAYAESLLVFAASGGLIRASDLIVAATAIANGYALLTDNVADFERIPDLEVRRPAWPEPIPA